MTTFRPSPVLDWSIRDLPCKTLPRTGDYKYLEQAEMRPPTDAQFNGEARSVSLGVSASADTVCVWVQR